MWRLCKAVNHILQHRPARRLLPPIVDGRAPTLEEQTTCQSLAMETCKESCTSDMYVCGAGLFDFGHCFKKAFITQPTLICADSALSRSCVSFARCDMLRI